MNKSRDQYFARKVMITGGLGFIGSNLAIALVELGAEVTLLDSLLPEFGGNLFNIEPVYDRVRLNIADMRDTHALDVLVKKQDFIFHLAGQVSHGDSMRDPKQDLAVNCISTMNLVESCRRYNPTARLIYTSTRQIYGVPGELPVTEEHPALPVDVNGINKLAGEYYHLLYDRTYDLRSTVLRLTNTYGPRQQIRNNHQGFIGVFIRQALKKQRISIFGDGQQLRDFNYVDDVVDALLMVAVCDDCYGNVYNLGSPVNYSLVEFVEILQEHVGVDYEFTPFPKDMKLIDIGDYYGDYSLFQTATAWQPKIDLREGIARSIGYYLDHDQEYWA